MSVRLGLNLAVPIAATAWLAVAYAGQSRAGDAEAARIEQGRYLSRAGDCVACHTGPEGKPFAGGLMMETPFGTISTPNITPDKETGIGSWSDDDFYRAMHEGIGHKGEYLYPVFPFPWYTKVTREDALAIKAYLFSLPPENAPRKPIRFRFPFNIRTSLLAWRTAFFKPGTFQPDPNKSPEENRGAYLVEGLGHCGECHNKSKVLGASDLSGKLEGGEIQGWYAPNITSDGKEGIGSWSVDELVAFLHDGKATGRGIAVGPMKETVDHSLSYLSDTDLKAMAVYLKSFKGTETYKPLDATQQQNAGMAGAEAYLSNCASCHGVDGKGVPGMIPALAGNGSVTAKGPQNVIRAVVEGLPASSGMAPMPAAGAALSDETVAAIVDYVRTAWGNSAPAGTGPGLVASLRPKGPTLMNASPGSGCAPSRTDPSLASAIDAAGASAMLKGLQTADLLKQIDVLLPKVKAGDPSVADDDLVNAMIATYCPIAMADATVPAPDRTALLGSFGSLVYGRLRAEEMGTKQE